MVKNLVMTETPTVDWYPYWRCQCQCHAAWSLDALRGQSDAIRDALYDDRYKRLSGHMSRLYPSRHIIQSSSTANAFVQKVSSSMVSTHHAHAHTQLIGGDIGHNIFSTKN